MANAVWCVHKMNGGLLENADAEHHLCELTANAQSTVQPMSDGTQSNALVWKDFSESMVLALHVQLELSTTPQLDHVKTFVGPMKLSMVPNVFADKISTELAQPAHNARPEQASLPQLELASLAASTKSSQILSVFVG
jgi:hypothetical protein